MTASHRASQPSLTSSNGTLTLAATMPTNEFGDRLLAFAVACHSSEPNITAPAGWTLVAEHLDGSGTSYLKLAIYKRVSNGSEPANYTFETTGSTSARFAVGISAYSVAGDTALASLTNQEAASVSRVTPTISVPTSRRVIAVFAGRNGETWTDPGSTSRRIVQGSANASLLVVDAVTSGSTSYTATASSSNGTGVTAILTILDGDVVLEAPTVTKGATTDASTVGGDDGEQVVTWPAVAGAASYEAWIAPGPEPEQGDFTLVQTGVTSPYTFDGLSAGEYAYGIKAKA